MGKLSTHVLDTTQGKPGAGVEIELYLINGAERTLLKRDTTNQDGRCAVPLLEGEAMQPGQYELVFAAGDYFASQGVDLPSPRFVDRVTIGLGFDDSGVIDDVQLVVTPWSYSTYRGS